MKKRVCKKWTNSEIDELKKMIKFDEDMFVTNGIELSEHFNCKPDRVYSLVKRLRQRGELDSIYWDDPLNPMLQPYTEQEDKIIVSMTHRDIGAKHIAKELDRTTGSINSRKRVLRDKGVLVYRNRVRWTSDKRKLLKSKIEYDKYGYVTNAEKLSLMFGVSKKTVQDQIYRMRKMGEITVVPDRSTPCVINAKRMTDLVRVDLMYINSR